MLLDVQRRGAADQQLPEQSLCKPTRDASVRPAPRGREQRDEREQQLSLFRAYGRPGKPLCANSSRPSRWEECTGIAKQGEECTGVYGQRTIYRRNHRWSLRSHQQWPKLGLVRERRSRKEANRYLSKQGNTQANFTRFQTQTCYCVNR